jgi:hypothetical protein
MNLLYVAIKLASLIAAIVGTLTIARQRLSYFTNIRTYMASACLMFSCMVAASIVPELVPWLVYEGERVVSTLALTSAIMLGFSAATLVDFPEKRSARQLLAAAIERGDYHLLGFLSVMFVGVIVTWIPQFVQGVAQFKPEQVGNATTLDYESWYAGYLFLAIAAIWAYPCYKFFRLYQTTKDSKVRRATLVFFFCIFAITSSALIVNVISVFLEVHFPGGITSFATAMSYLILALVFKETKTLTLYFEDFSRSLGLTRQQVRGHSILLEFDPRSDSQKVVRDFIDEAAANTEPAIILTYSQSVVYSTFNNRKDLTFLLTTPQVSAPIKKSETEILLPENASIWLDSLDRFSKAKSDTKVNVVVDNLSDLILSMGFERTYSFLRYALDMLTSTEATALFLMNPTAHETKIVSSIRNLFGWQLYYGEEGLRVVKLPISRE